MSQELLTNTKTTADLTLFHFCPLVGGASLLSQTFEHDMKSHEKIFTNLPDNRKLLKGGVLEELILNLSRSYELRQPAFAEEEGIQQSKLAQIKSI